MKNTLLVIAVMVVGACATPLTPEEKKVVGTYKPKISSLGHEIVFLENGIAKSYLNGKENEETKWKITKEGELHVTNPDSEIGLFRINKDGSITTISYISKDGKREEAPK